MQRYRIISKIAAAAILFAASADLANAQQSDADRLAQNQAASEAILTRDNVATAFRDASTSASVVIVQPDSRLVCAGSPETLHLYYTPPRPSVVSYRCVTSISDQTAGTFDLELRTIGLTPDAARLMAQIGAPNMVDQTTPSLAEMWADEIQGRPWEGFRVEVGGGTSPPHPPFEIVRSQGVRAGRDVYLRVAWARVGDWMFVQRVEAPLESQVTAEGLAALQFYNALLAAQPPAP